MACNAELQNLDVKEAIGNWGFFNKVSNAGSELKRLRYIANKMDSFKTKTPMMCVQYNYKYDPEAWTVNPSPIKCKPVWTFPINRPLITYSSTADIILTSNLNEIGSDLVHIIPGRNYVLQGTDKWYQCSPSCSSPSTPQCSRPCQ